MKITLLSLVFVLLTMLPATAYSQLGSGVSSDARVKKALDQLGAKYTIDGDGDFKLVYEVDSRRTQLVFINSETETYGEFEIREIWSVGYESSSPFSAAIANKLLEDNEAKKLGGWQTKRINGKYAAVYTAKVSAVMTADQIETVLTAVFKAADSMEKELTSKDDF